MYTVQQIIDAFSFGSPDFVTLIIAFAIANTIGLLEYFWAVALNVKEHYTPFPVWMHTYFFANDSTCAVVLLGLGFSTGFWLFWVYGGGMLIWTVLEIINMRTVAKYESEEAFGRGTTAGQAALLIVFQAACMLIFVNLIRVFMGDVAMFMWLPITNFVMAVGPGYVLYRRKSRKGSSVFIYIMIVAGTLFNFMPPGIGLFTTSLPQVFDQPIWYLMGVIATVIAIYNLRYILKLPKKELLPNGKKPIW